MSRRRFLATGIAAVGSLLLGRSVAEVYRFDVERHAVSVEGLGAPLRIAFLTDLHFGPYVGAGSLGAWVDACLAERPDLIVLGGDIVDAAAPADVTPAVDALRRLRAPLGTVLVWGNHDHTRFRELAPFERAVREVGVVPLRNDGVRVRDDLYVAGIDDHRWGRPDLAMALAGRPDGVPTVLLSHNPDVLPEVPTDVALTLCGHTHGGQVRLPLVGAVVTSSAHGQRFAQGWVEGPARGYVSRGLGVSLLPIRVACPAELSIFDLLPAPT